MLLDLGHEYDPSNHSLLGASIEDWLFSADNAFGGLAPVELLGSSEGLLMLKNWLASKVVGDASSIEPS